MSFLPGSLTPAFRSPWCAHIVASLRQRTYLIRTVIQLLNVEKTKRADYTEHQESAGAWLSLQSDVLCNRLWKFKVGFCFLPAPTNRTKGVMEQFGTSGVQIPCRMKPTYSIWSNSLFSCLCSGEPLCHYYTDNVLCRQGCKPSHYIRNFKRWISTDVEKFSLPVRTFSREISTGKK